METMNTLRKSQSLRSLSGFGVKERSWETSKSSLWDNKKSVSQLVQHYQSCVELSTSETNEEKIKVCNASLSFSSPREEMSVGLVSPWRRLESRGYQVDRLGTDSGSFMLSRSRSMDHLPQRDRAPEGTSALRALFESKATLQEDVYSSTRLNIASPASRMVAGIQSSEIEKDRPLGAEAPRTEKTRPWSVACKRVLFQQETVTTVKTVVSSSRTMPGSSATTTKQKTEQVKSTPSAVKKYISISDGKTESAGKTKKSVRFSPSLDDDLDKEDSPSASELNSDRENQNQNGHPGYASVEEIDNNITMKQGRLSVEAEEREVQSEAIYNPYQYNSHEKITDPYEYNSHEKMEGLNGEHVDSAQASVAEHAGIGVSQENTQFEVPVAVNTNSESLNGLLLTSDIVDNPHVVQVNDHSTPEATTVNLPEPAGMMDIGAEQVEQSDSVDQKVRKSEPNLDEKNRTNTENQLDGSDEVQQQETTVDQSKGVGRSNSSKSYKHDFIVW